MAEPVKSKAKDIYRLLAETEAEVHGCKMDNIHFRVLGTMDAVADICDVCFIVNELGVEKVIATPVCTATEAS